MKTDKEIYDFCRARYYCGYNSDDENYNQLCEEYECWDEKDVEELIEMDIEAHKEFLKEG